MHDMIFINLVAGTKDTLLTLPVWKSIVISLMTFFTVLCVYSGYILGYKDIVLMDKLMYKNKKDKKK